MQPFFSIIVVCLNPGDKLKATLESIHKQTFQDYEVVIKDGFSTDGSLECIEQVFTKEQIADCGQLASEDELVDCEKRADAVSESEQAWDTKSKVFLMQEKDTGIYDAMNQAAGSAKGKYVYYLNCGDLFYADTVLKEMADFIKESPAYKEAVPGIYYGNIFERLTGQQVASNPKIDAFGCYRNVPCHQACFYSRALLLAHPFETKYKVRADYEQFLWCFFVGDTEKQVSFAYKDMIVADYEGGGFSETKENRRISAAEHKEITGKYMSAGQRMKYRAVLALTLASLRTALAENEKTAGLYNKLKERIYSMKKG
ncbi:MAG: glycosyltransferase [Lachnospiraceae bacterium]|nr:glycosyltransferase [Lachnospiraceae bacterium]